MTFWTRLRLAGTVIVLVISMLAMLADLLHGFASDSPEATPTPRRTQPSDSLRAPRETSGL
jgi:hypothetical protein